MIRYDSVITVLDNKDSYSCQQYDGDDDNTFPLNENGMWKLSDKSDLLGTWKVHVHI
jgi:hypothetical protein